jgi:hypothetical protein
MRDPDVGEPRKEVTRDSQKRPNQAMQRTASRLRSTFSVFAIHLFPASGAAAGSRSPILCLVRRIPHL